jgi:hypothetical protein
MILKIILLILILVPSTALAQTEEPPINPQRSIVEITETDSAPSTPPSVRQRNRKVGTGAAAIVLVIIAGYAAWTLNKTKPKPKKK